MSEPVIIWGCGGHGREVNWLCEQAGVEVVGFLDERSHMKGVIVDDIPVLGDIKDIEHLRGKVEVICAGVGDTALKEKFVEKTKKYGFAFSRSICHPAVTISRRNQIGIGCLLFEGTIMTINIKLDNFVIINRKTTIGHDVQIGDYVTVAPGVNISGNVCIGEGTYLGTGVSVREKVNIGCWSMVGGGSFVKNNIPDKVLYAGVPAKFKKGWGK